MNMYRMGLIAESLFHKEVIDKWKENVVNTKIQEVEGDEEPVWHTYELQFPEKDILNIIEELKNEIKPTWYVHTFNEENLFVIMKDKYFQLPLERDESWNEMIEYGSKVARIDPYYLESISCVI